MENPLFGKIHVAIMTVDRPQHYLHKVLSHLRKDLPLRLVVGSPSYGYLERYRRNPNLEIIGVDPTEWDRIKGCSLMHRASWNYWRCFTYGIRPGERKGLLILEDDVVPAKGWEARLCQAIEQIESEYGDQYVLSLYTAYTKPPKQAVAGQYYTRYPILGFYGTQAMYYPEPIRVGFAEYLRREGVDTIRLSYDFLLAEYLKFTGIPLFVTTPCLFEHIGEITTGLCPSYHRAGYFAKKLR